MFNSENAKADAGKQRTRDAWRAEGLFEDGIGHVVMARYKGGGRRIETGVFLVDVWCLGVKSAFYTELTPEKFHQELMVKVAEDQPMNSVAPCCARKLIERSVQYAARLGLAAHPDYRYAARVFGGIDATECSEEFTFGKDGKPLYWQGPHDTPERVAFILRQLEAHCGSGNWDFVLGGPVP